MNLISIVRKSKEEILQELRKENGETFAVMVARLIPRKGRKNPKYSNFLKALKEVFGCSGVIEIFTKAQG